MQDLKSYNELWHGEYDCLDYQARRRSLKAKEADEKRQALAEHLGVDDLIACPTNQKDTASDK